MHKFLALSSVGMPLLYESRLKYQPRNTCADKAQKQSSFRVNVFRICTSISGVPRCFADAL